MNLVWTRQACRRLAEIQEFVATESPVAAEEPLNCLAPGPRTDG